jgi:hypothetical protein
MSINKSIPITWCCPQCNQESLIHVFLGTPAITIGPPEICQEAEPTYIESATCHFCAAAIDVGDAEEQAVEEIDI